MKAALHHEATFFGYIGPDLFTGPVIKFTDNFTLLKVDGEWKIISKVFYLHP